MKKKMTNLAHPKTRSNVRSKRNREETMSRKTKITVLRKGELSTCEVQRKKRKKKATYLMRSKSKGRILKLRKRKQSFDSESHPDFFFPFLFFSAYWLRKTHRYLKTRKKK